MMLSYELLEGIKMVRHNSEVISRTEMEKFRYKRLHVVAEISEKTIMHYLEKSVLFEVQVVEKVYAMEELGRDSESNSNTQGRKYDQSSGTEEMEVKEFYTLSPPQT